VIILRKVVSGGQTGADRAGLIVAREFGLETGGWLPKGCQTAAGPRPDLIEKYGMQEHPSPNYAARTYANAKDSDATIRLAMDFGSRGEICTLNAIKRYHKPWTDIDLAKPRPPVEVAEWLTEHQVGILNVAGNSEKTFSGTFDLCTIYLRSVLSALGLDSRVGNQWDDILEGI